jgi:hypothetical protein
MIPEGFPSDLGGDRFLGAACRSYRRLSRRSWLASPVAALGGLSLTWIAESLAKDGEDPRAVRGKSSGKARSLIFLWMQGGPSQLETWDPHPGRLIGGSTRAIATSLPGVQIAEGLPQMAEQLHRVTLVRSIIGKEGDHERATYQMKTGWRPDPTVLHPSLGAILCHQTADNLEIPRHVSILSRQWPGRGGYLGASYDSFRVNDPRDRVPNLRSNAPAERLERRVRALEEILEPGFARQRFADLDLKKTQHVTATRQALQMMASDQVSAFDIMQESQGVRQAFGDSAFGRGCLAAVRLIERGVRCVEVELNGWDSHADNHRLQLEQCRILDPALASLLQELERRELLASTLVVCGGEFGRTPKLNVLEGRDHWQHGFSWLMAGGPLRRGQVVGQTAAEPIPDGGEKSDYVAEPVAVADLHATLLDSLGIDYRKELTTPIGRPLPLSEGQVVQACLERPLG